MNNKKTILVVEDEAITAMDTQRSLQQLGYNVPCIASSGEEAIVLEEKLKPSLILMDIGLKGKLNGTEAAEVIANQSSTPIIFLTAYNDENTFLRAKKSMPYAYLTKPYDSQDLRIAVELALHKHLMEMESFAETNRIKSEFLANMSHELRTPLNGIIGFTELMFNEKIGKTPLLHKEYLQDILISSKHLLHIINDMLDITKTESGKMEFVYESVNLLNLINEVKKSIQPLIEEKKIFISVYVDPALTIVRADYIKLKQILYNYISNAIKFSHEEGLIEIRATQEGKDFYRIDVKDYGVGVDEKDIKNLFMPFKQLDTSYSKNYQGTGLGLALTKRLVEAQQGQVGVVSKLGKGSVFFLLLPHLIADQNSDKNLKKTKEYEKQL